MRVGLGDVRGRLHRLGSKVSANGSAMVEIIESNYQPTKAELEEPIYLPHVPLRHWPTLCSGPASPA